MFYIVALWVVNINDILAKELKVGYNKASKPQLWWRNELNERGYVAEICTGIDEALEVINRYLDGKISES